MCEECYVDEKRITPLLKSEECLRYHTQYICGTCGRCICIERDPKRGVQRWNFPFHSLQQAKLYLRTADYTLKKNCGIYEIHSHSGRRSYKIFSCLEDVEAYLKKNKDKSCDMQVKFQMNEYKEFPYTQVRKLTEEEIERYLKERER